MRCVSVSLFYLSLLSSNRTVSTSLTYSERNHYSDRLGPPSPTQWTTPTISGLYWLTSSICHLPLRVAGGQNFLFELSQHLLDKWSVISDTQWINHNDFSDHCTLLLEQLWGWRLWFWVKCLIEFATHIQAPLGINCNFFGVITGCFI